jgi:hypothetical protein
MPCLYRIGSCQHSSPVTELFRPLVAGAALAPAVHEQSDAGKLPGEVVLVP